MENQFFSLGLFYSSLSMQSQTAISLAPFAIASKEIYIENCTFNWYDPFGMVQVIGSDFASDSDLSLTLKNNHFTYNSDSTYWDLDTYSHTSYVIKPF